MTSKGLPMVTSVVLLRISGSSESSAKPERGVLLRTRAFHKRGGMKRAAKGVCGRVCSGGGEDSNMIALV